MLTIAKLIGLYLHGDPARGWHGAKAEYPHRPGGGRTTEAVNMAYALRDLRDTVIHLDAGDVRGTRPGLIGAARHIEDLTPDQFGPSDLRAVQQHMIKIDCCRNTINARKNRILRFFRWMVSFEHCDQALLERIACVTPVKAHYPGVRETRKVTSPSPEAVGKTVACARPEVQRAINLQRCTGMRPGELVAMRVCDLRLGEGIDSHGERAKVWEFHPRWHKTAGRGLKRIIPFGPDAQAILRDQATAMFDRGGQGDLFGCGVPRLGDREDTRRLWSWTTTNGYYQAVKKARERAGVARWAPNQLRHELLTKACRLRGEDVAASIAGHSDPKTTRRNYIDEDDGGAKQFALDFG